MSEAIAYLNGSLLPASRAVLPVTDSGLVMGAAITEQLRTFAGKLFRVEAHLERLRHSAVIVGLEEKVDWNELARVAERLVERNHGLLAPGDDLGLSVFITPGTYPTFASSSSPPAPVVCMHTYPLPFRLWAEKYTTGQSLVTTSVEQIPSSCLPPELKCRSRMHYYLADREATQIEPGARALLLDHEGRVMETSTANIVLYREGEGLVAPPSDRALRGISLETVGELAERLGMVFARHDLFPEDVARADEVLLCSTPLCLLPVTRFNGTPIGDGKPGVVFGRLLEAWSELVGVEPASQARRFAQRG